MTHKLDFYTQYSQFYLCDKNSHTNPNSDILSSNEVYNDRLGMDNGLLFIRTECYGPVKGEINIREKANDNIDYNLYDHIVECGLEVKSGILQVKNCPFFTVMAEIKVKPGNYRVRVYSSNLSSVHDDEGEDYYKIEIWPNNNMKRNVLKRYELK